MRNSSKTNKPKIIVILGPTATGKSALAVRLARTIKNAEVISADSRQVYKGLDIGSGKITAAEMKGVPHHMLDVASPKIRSGNVVKNSGGVFTVAQFQKMGQKIVSEITARGNTPIICGGSAFYIQALVDSTVFPEVLPNPKLRARLEKMPIEKLQVMLKKLDVRRYKEIDKDNPVRLVRAIEIATALGKVPALPKFTGKKSGTPYNPLFIGINIPATELHKKIKKRLESRTKDGMVAEVATLHKAGVSWKRLESFGLEYRAIAEFLQEKKISGKNGKNGVAGKKITEKEMLDKLEINICQFAKRQMTWFKKDTRIRWYRPNDWQKIKTLAQNFIKRHSK